MYKNDKSDSLLLRYIWYLLKLIWFGLQELQKEADASKSSRSTAMQVPKVEAFKTDQFSTTRPASFGSAGLEVNPQVCVPFPELINCLVELEALARLGQSCWYSKWRMLTPSFSYTTNS